MRLDGKVALITGASRGIGRAIALRLGREGAAVVVNYSGNLEAARETVAAVEAAGGRAVPVQADVGQVAEVERLFDETIRHLGRLDILVNNAGVLFNKPLAEVTEEGVRPTRDVARSRPTGCLRGTVTLSTWKIWHAVRRPFPFVSQPRKRLTSSVGRTPEEEFDRIFAVNLKGTFFTCQQAARRMAEGGRIINLSSSTTALMLPTYAAYVATKGAVEQLSHVLAKELGLRGITVNVISPGPTDTELFGQGKTEQDKQRFAQMAALGRLGRPEDIADVVALLVSEEARWITGQNIRANGGLI